MAKHTHPDVIAYSIREGSSISTEALTFIEAANKQSILSMHVFTNDGKNNLLGRITRIYYISDDYGYVKVSTIAHFIIVSKTGVFKFDIEDKLSVKILTDLLLQIEDIGDFFLSHIQRLNNKPKRMSPSEIERDAIELITGFSSNN